ncbi:MAG: MFS transporter [Paludibacteraceae bacterium]|nr:MFS transporter [Paludibacteraceae bacterium]
MTEKKSLSPWFWVPTLYFAEGVPYFLVNNISVMMFAKMGVPNDQLAFFTTLLYFPWFLKGIWSPIVDVVKTKRWWIVSMQVLMTVLCVLLTVTLPHPDAATIAAKGTHVSMFSLTLVLFIIAAFASATHDIAADGYYMLAHSQSSQAKFIGIRSTFYRIASVFGQGVLVFIAGLVEKSSGDIPYSWQVTLGVTAVVMFLITLYHIFVLPKSDNDKPRASAGDTGASMRELGNSFKTFFTKPGVGLAILFMLLYRLPEGFLIKLCQPFLVDQQAEVLTETGKIIGGGLGLSTENVGILYGTIGVIALLLGGIVGGVFISKRGLKKSLWWMAACMTLPCLTFVYLSTELPENLWAIGTAISIEQFGYGFGFTAYMMYMMYFSEGEFKTSHYAICTAFMALSMMLPGFVAGTIEMAIGYKAFFWMVVACSVATLLVTFLAYRKLDPEYGKK